MKFLPTLFNIRNRQFNINICITSKWLYECLKLKHPLSILMLLSLLTSCNLTQYLEKDEYIVYKNKINLKNVNNKKYQKSLEAELSTLYKQKELPDLFFSKRKSGAWYYFEGLKDTSPSRFKEWQYKNFSTKPAFFDEMQTDLTIQNMKQYLKNKGYLYPIVTYDKDFRNKDKGFAYVSYHIDAGKLYVLDTVRFICRDTAILYFLNDIADKSFLKTGTPLSSSLYEQERTRITNELNNIGYARFTPNYISQIVADTIDTGMDSKGNRRVNISLTIQLPAERETHQKFYTADVIIYPNYDALTGETIAKDTIVDGKIFFTYDGKLGISPNPLVKSIPLRSGNVYNKTDIDDAIRQLTNLGVYKFVNIKPNVEDCDSTLITYKIYLTPSKKMSYESGVELNYSNITTTKNSTSGTLSNLGRFGLAFDLNFENKNLFNGAERFNSIISGGVDFGLAGGAAANNGLSSDLRFDNNLSVPKFVRITNSWKLLNKVGIIKTNFLNDMIKNGSTDFNVGYNNSDRRGLNQYRLQQFNLGFKYVLKKTNGIERYTVSPTGVELNLNDLREEFLKRIPTRTAKSFESQLLTGLAFRSFTYEYNEKQNVLGVRRQLSGSIEQSGSEILLLEKLINRKTPFKVNQTVDFSRFLRGEVDLRYTKQLSSKRFYAARLAVGVSVPLSDGINTPYSRLFYVGGPNSIRAWPIRGVGPGTFIDTSFKGVPFQAGDMKIEFNSEFRFPLIWRLESAIFLDAGNVWDIKESFAGAKFSNTWFKELAIGTGVGMRLDVSYAVIRLDFGYKLHTPYSLENNQSQWIGLTGFKWGNFNTNFALGLPF